MNQATMSIGETFFATLNMTNKSYKSILVLLLVIQIPFTLGIAALEVGGPQYVIPIIGLSLTKAIGQFLLTIGVILILEKALAGQKLKLGEMFSGIKPHLVLMITTGIISGIYVGLLSLALVIPGIIFGVYWIFTTQAVVLDGKKNMDAMDQSKALVQKRWWSTFIKMIAVHLPIVLPFIVLAIGVGFMSTSTPEVSVFPGLLIELLADFIYPFSIIAMYVIYNDYKANPVKE